MRHDKLTGNKHLNFAVTVIVVFVGLLLAAPPNVYPAQQKIDSNFNMLDGSWAIAIAGASANSQLSGRDFVFTYGPLYQLFHGFGLLVPPRNLGSLLRFQYCIEVVAVMLGAWFV